MLPGACPTWFGLASWTYGDSILPGTSCPSDADAPNTLDEPCYPGTLGSESECLLDSIFLEVLQLELYCRTAASSGTFAAANHAAGTTRCMFTSAHRPLRRLLEVANVPPLLAQTVLIRSPARYFLNIHGPGYSLVPRNLITARC